MTKEKIEQKAFDESVMYDTIQEKNASYNSALKMANWLLDNLWISVEDELPQFDKVVIVHYEDDSQVGEMFSHRTKREFIVKDKNDFCLYYCERITHWMPIPQINKK